MATGTPSSETKVVARPLVDGSMIFFIVLALVSMVLVYLLKGGPALTAALGHAWWLMVGVVPLIALGMMLGGFARELADPKKIAPILGAQSGWLGLILATTLGAVTPGGPFAAFPIVYALFLAGADVGAVIAFLTAWSVIGVHRIVVWELPLLGPEFVIVRVLTSLPLPVLAGAAARLLARGPLAIARPEQVSERSRKDPA
ncbi:MAG: permease [Hyphomicrobiaceae bacterium]